MQIKVSAIDFWGLGFDVMQLQHEKKIYPPRVKITIILKNTEDTVVPIKFVGCSIDSQLDVDLPFPLYNIGNNLQYGIISCHSCNVQLLYLQIMLPTSLLPIQMDH